MQKANVNSIKSWIPNQTSQNRFKMIINENYATSAKLLIRTLGQDNDVVKIKIRIKVRQWIL